MNKRHDERFENDPTPSREVAQRYREAIYDEDREVTLALLHYRGGAEEFLIGKDYCTSGNAEDRATGADILAQLGWGDQTFHAESIEILTGLLGDIDDYVVCRAAVGLGQRSAKSAIPDLLKLMDHSDPQVRYGVVFGLTGHEDDRAIAGLIRLAGDDDRDVRDWAVFGLGTQIDCDSPEIREALRSALGDADHEIRGEALVGLAKRGDPGIVAELINEWKHDEISLLSIEAAGESRDPRLYHRLTRFLDILTTDDDPYFAKRLHEAIAACNPEAKVVPPEP